MHFRIGISFNECFSDLDATRNARTNGTKISNQFCQNWCNMPFKEWRIVLYLLYLFTLDCKTVGFFSKSVKKSVKRGVRALRARSVQVGRVRREKKNLSPQSRSLFSASFQTFCLTALAYLNTQKYGLFCSLCLPVIIDMVPT